MQPTTTAFVGTEPEVILAVRGLTRTFGSGRAIVHAVDGIDLSVSRGELVLIMGPSGSGKTTLLTLIGGLLRPSSGTVIVNGLEITRLNERRLTKFRRHYLGFVFQSFNLLESLNARENVEVTLNFAGVGGRKAQKRATALLTDLGMADRLRAKPHTLSGGERQRVSIARALANDPQLILADEPTANLDSRHGHEVVELLHDIAKAQQRTIVIVSHDHRIRDVADRVLWLQDGRFEQFDQPDAHQSALLDTAKVLYGAAPQASASPAAQPVEERRGGWFPWRRA
ncbi:MAG TPA: ABC transporter ATP-binding protein [Dehalococcoidia bacterium]|nr:ABC transporter ATP-binding protein [Dehalococcoidia bacterium]